MPYTISFTVNSVTDVGMIAGIASIVMQGADELSGTDLLESLSYFTDMIESNWDYINSPSDHSVEVYLRHIRD